MDMNNDEYQKFLSKIFPSNHMSKKIEQMEQLEKSKKDKKEGKDSKKNSSKVNKKIG